MRMLVFFAALSTVAAADPVTLKIKLPKGKSFKVDQTVGLTSDASPSSKLKNGAVVTTITQVPFALSERWTDTCVEEKDGVPQQLRRTILSSRLATAKTPAAPTSQEGCVFLFARTDKGSSVKTEKGKPEDLSVRLLEKGVPELMEALLPDHDVSEGDEWKVETSMNSGFQLSAGAGKAGAQGPAKNALREDIDHMDEKKSPIGVGIATSGGCEVKGKLKSVKDGVATLEFTGEQSTDSIAGANGMPDIPKFKTTVSGTLTFNIDAGMPLKLMWHQKHISEDQDTPNGKIPGFTEDWAMTRSYSK